MPLLTNEQTWPDELAEAHEEPRQAIRCQWLSNLVRRLFWYEPELSTNEHMRQHLGRPEVPAKPNCRVVNRG